MRMTTPVGQIGQERMGKGWKYARELVANPLSMIYGESVQCAEIPLAE